MNVQEKFSATRSELSASLIERDSEVDLVLTALIAQQHCLLVGLPGTAKSMLSDAIVGWMAGQKFSYLMTKFTTPEEICGPVSIQGLKADEYRRIVAGKLPEADVAFLDEVFKSSSAILNTMLTILNERTYRNNGHLLQCPLKLCIGASNEWPGDQEGGRELGALFDRFLLRKLVRPIGTDKGLDRLLWSDTSVHLSTSITPAEIEQANKDAFALSWEQDAKDSFLAILHELKREGVQPGDRRVRQSVGAVQAYAWLNEAATVESDHLEVLMHCLWDDPQEQPKKCAEIVAKIANPVGAKVNQLLMEAEEVTSKANLKDLGQAASAAKKLSEINKQLKGLTGARAKSAQEHVAATIKAVKLATVEAL
jgi:MoxR-like ATPase